MEEEKTTCYCDEEVGGGYSFSDEYGQCDVCEAKNTKHKLLVYGSLRKGMYNYNAFAGGLEYIETKTLKGYEMYSLGAYPFVVKNPDEEIVVDVMLATPASKARIDAMEFGAGYEAEEVDGATIYYFTEKYESPYRETPKVEKGDWIEWNEQKKNAH